MDRSYPYSRRLLSRTRLHKRMAGVAAAGLVGATVLLLMTWRPDPISAALPTASLPAFAAGSELGQAGGVRRIYPYSVIPGGVSGKTELARVIRTDRVVAAHYASFDVEKARPVVVEKPRAVHVSYRKGGKVYWTARKVMLAEGETLLSDGRNEMRARCANRISDVPQYPVEAHQPAMEELDQPIEAGEGEQIARGTGGLPVSVPGDDGLSSHAGARLPFGGGSGISAPGPVASADTMLARSSYAPFSTDAGTLSTSALSGSSSSLSSRSRPAAAPSPETSSGSDSGAASGSPASSGGPTGSVAAPPGASDSPATGTSLAELGIGVPAAPGGTAQSGTPLTTPEPQTPSAQLPDTGLPPALTPATPSLPGGQQSGGGSTEQLPVPPAGSDPQAFIPRPVLNPTPPQGNTLESKPPADVPEPGSIWLLAGALPALCVLRRRNQRSQRSIVSPES